VGRQEAGILTSRAVGRRAVVKAGIAGAASTLVPRGADPAALFDRQEGGMEQGTRLVETPGLVDLQVNGFAGVDFGDPALTPERLLQAIGAIEETGVTRFLPTLITSSLPVFSACARTIVRTAHAAVAGLHMEGPYISPEDGFRGAHVRAFVRGADLDDFRRRQEAAEGRIRLVTLAPEAPGALRLVEHLVASGVRVALGHTAATGAQIADAVRAGATLSTHLGNGCAGVLPRHPNVIWEQLGEDRLLASFIVDGHHLPPATVRSMIRAKTPARTILVTDAIAAAGMPPGRYTLGGQAVELSATGRVAAPGASHLAGSALRLDVAIGNTVRFSGLSLEEVMPMASTRPAEYLGIPTTGRVTAEWDAAASSFRVRRVET
jgi:N-acetylglucosamine-6-phosphate deacetylase